MLYLRIPLIALVLEVNCSFRTGFSTVGIFWEDFLIFSPSLWHESNRSTELGRNYRRSFLGKMRSTFSVLFTVVPARQVIWSLFRSKIAQRTRKISEACRNLAVVHFSSSSSWNDCGESKHTVPSVRANRKQEEKRLSLSFNRVLQASVFCIKSESSSLRNRLRSSALDAWRWVNFSIFCYVPVG